MFPGTLEPFSLDVLVCSTGGANKLISMKMYGHDVAKSLKNSYTQYFCCCSKSNGTPQKLSRGCFCKKLVNE